MTPAPAAATLDWRRGDRYLAFSPHPDDAELGCGGTLWQLAHGGAAVRIVVVTDGRLGTRDPALTPAEVAELRAQEAAAAANALSADLRRLGLPDGGPHDPYDLRDRLMREIRLWRPDYVFACDPWLPYEAHSDHRAVGLAAAEAALLSGLVHCAPDSGEPWTVAGILFYFPARADILNPLSRDALAARERAIACHASQFAPGDPYLERLGREMADRGATLGSPAAEALHLRRRTDLHIPSPA